MLNRRQEGCVILFCVWRLLL